MLSSHLLTAPPPPIPDAYTEKTYLEIRLLAFKLD